MKCQFVVKWNANLWVTCITVHIHISHAVGEEKINEQLFVTIHRLFKKLWIWEELWFEYKGWHLMCPMKRHGIQELSMVEFWCSSSACVESRCFSCLMYWDGHYTSVPLKCRAPFKVSKINDLKTLNVKVVGTYS